MEARYDVFMGDRRIGTLQLREAGLYYQLSCICSLEKKDMHELWCETAHGNEKLGVLIPDDIGCGIHTKIPRRRLGQGSIRFYVAPRTAPHSVSVEPLDPHVPFCRIMDLATARFVRRGNDAGILFSDEK